MGFAGCAVGSVCPDQVAQVEACRGTGQRGLGEAAGIAAPSAGTAGILLARTSGS